MVKPLSPDELDRFVAEGYVRLDQAFSTAEARAAASSLFASGGVDPDNPATWPGPASRIAGSSDPSVVATINTDKLAAAIDQLVGESQWEPRTTGFGTFPIRFPSDDDPGDAGWHIDGSFGEPPHYRVNFASRGRALLLLMLFTDVGENDAPTRIKVGSHLDVARALHKIGRDIAFVPERDAASGLDHPIASATGPAGTVYLCHPFLIHSATWPHTGVGPRLIAQPSIHHPEGEQRGEFDYHAEPRTPVKNAVRVALGRT